MKSTLAPNKRYLLVRLAGERPVDGRQARAEVARHIEAFFGIEGMAQAQPRILDKLCKDDRLVLRCARGEEMRLVAALALLGKISGMNARAKVVKISGTLRALGAMSTEGE